MNVPTRLAAFAGVLAIAFGAAALAGAAIAPTNDHKSARNGHTSHVTAGGAGHAEPAMTGMGTEHGHGAAGGGLAISEGGYTMRPERTFLHAGERARLAFRIVDARGSAVRDGYQRESERELHLIFVRRDLRHYQHLHPVRDGSGTWSTEVTLPTPGVYRAYADFQIKGERHVLATDLFVAGDFQPHRLPAPESGARADGYGVALATAGLKGGGESELDFRVTRGGRPVQDLQPYLGAKGHLVALREGDLAYLHVHPDEAKVAADEIRFMAALPSAGRYRLFLQFRTGSRVHTVAYTVEVPR